MDWIIFWRPQQNLWVSVRAAEWDTELRVAPDGVGKQGIPPSFLALWISTKKTGSSPLIGSKNHGLARHPRKSFSFWV
jgi:hypothetical protein